MSEYINRKDAILVIAKRLNWESRAEQGNRFNILIDSRWLDEAADILADIPSADVVERKRGEWISCSDRLPHAEYGESDDVLTYAEDGLYRILYFDGGNWCYPTSERFEHSIYPVIAWQPLPEPYKADMRGGDNE